MAIYLKPAESGLRQGIGMLGQALSEGLKQRRSNQQQQALTQALMQASQAGMPEAGGAGASAQAGGAPQGQMGSSQDLGPLKSTLIGMSASADPAIRSGAQAALSQIQAQEKLSFQRERLERQEQMGFTKLNEPAINELNDNILSAEARQLDYDRLNEIFSNPKSKLPSAFSAAMFDLEGESGLSKFGRTQLSTDAQEAMKIIVNQLRGAKDTFGARITNFDAATYLKGLPTFLNTPDGRKRITKQLSTINQINALHDKATLDVVERLGGIGKIPLSYAKSIAKKEIAPQLSALRKQYINPNGSVFNVLPSPKSYEGKKIRDNVTGEVFISNGAEWVKEES